MKGPSGYLWESCGELKGPRVDFKALGEAAGSERVDLGCPGMDLGISEEGMQNGSGDPRECWRSWGGFRGVLEGFGGPKVDFMGI